MFACLGLNPMNDPKNHAAAEQDVKTRKTINPVYFFFTDDYQADIKQTVLGSI